MDTFIPCPAFLFADVELVQLDIQANEIAAFPRDDDDDAAVAGGLDQ
jgi:hypothetical protein